MADGATAQPARKPDALRVLSAGSALHGLRPAAALFASESGIAVDVQTDHGHNIRKHTLAGEANVDVIVVPTEWASEIVAAGRAAKSSLLAIGAVRIGAVVRADAPKPDVSTMPALRQALGSADAVLLTLAPTGDHLMQVIERFGLTATVTPKLKRFDTATLLNRHLVENADRGALGFGPATEILAWRDRGVAWGGPIPDEIQIVLPYSAAMLTGARADGSRALLAFLATPPARRFFLASGVE
jgi:molybdate transport system substrate-binding protein